MDNTIKELLDLEGKRQNGGIELIASENYPSKDIRDACGSIAIAKYAEGYPGRRYYGGCEYIDQIEQLAIDRVCKLFNCKFANVQPHCGSSANYAAYHALMPNGGTILSLALDEGGHLTHGSPVSFSSHDYNIVNYHLDSKGRLNYSLIEDVALNMNPLPNVILAGYSAYPYNIDFYEFRKIVDKVNNKSVALTGKPCCYLMVDMAHIAGIVAAQLCQSPIPYADIVTTTTHKTLRGPRGGMILTNNSEIAKRVNSAIFPYIQGGPLENIIAAKAIMAYEDGLPQFKKYMSKVLFNTKLLNDELAKYGATVSGTDNHLFLLNTIKSYNMTGKEVQDKLGEIGITLNKNMIQGDLLSPKETSGVRIGCAAITTRDINSAGIIELANIIDSYLKNKTSKETAQYRIGKITSALKDVNKLEV